MLKNLHFHCLWIAMLFLGFGTLNAQEVEQHSIQALTPSKKVDRQKIVRGQEIHIPGKGLLKPAGIEIKRLTRNDQKATIQQANTGALSMRHFNNQVATRHGFGNEGRNLDLNQNGNLLSVSGLEVEFKLPDANTGNPMGGGICATPIPSVIVPPNALAPVNCPMVVPCDAAAARDANIPTGATPIKFMKLNWIVVRDAAGTASSNINQSRIDQLMTEVNADFLPFRIQFCADPATFVNDGTHYSLNVGTEDGSLKTTYGVTPGNWINVYVVGSITNPSAGGYARFPYDPFGGYNIRGGLVLARGNLFLGTHTVAHELGHTFGLHHTFHGVDEVTPCTACYEDMGLSGQDSEGDWCSDTRPHPTNANICGDAGTDACTAIPFTGAPVNNHMSYSFCTSQFTPQQAGRMHCMIDSYLSNWVSFGGSTCGGLPPVADFSGTPTSWQAPMTVNFTDLSVPSPTITNWTWNFDVAGIGGVTPATFSGGPGVGDNPPPVQYTVCDTSYTVSLTVTNSNGADSETKINYIRATCPAGDCDTLFSHWNTPVSTPSIYTFAANDHVTGIPAPTLQGGPGTAPIGFYERYITPNPGTTTVGAVRAGLGNFLDADSNTTFQVVIYNANAAGAPVGAPLGGLAGIEPGGDLGVPAGFSFFEFWIPFDKVTIDSATFLVGVEIFPGNNADRLTVVSSAAGQGQNAGLNFVASNGFGYVNYNTFVGIDFDLDLIPMLGPWQTEFFATGFGALQACDSTLVLLTDSALFHPCMTNVTVTSALLGSITDSLLANVDSLFFLYTMPGPDTVTFETVNMCGRTDVVAYTLNYPFDTTPGPIDFVMNLTNPICAGTVITFTGTPTGGANYIWDFGDGTVASSGASNSTTHTYAAPGLYYVGLTVVNSTTCNASTTKLDFVEIIDCSVNAPVAAFSVAPDSVCLGDPFNFTDASVGVPDPATNWFWAFDDGTFSLSQNPTHTYSAAGTYNVMFVASNVGGNDTTFFSVRVLALPCLLPSSIELKANPSGNSIFLTWESVVDPSQVQYDILRSLDGSNYTKLGSIPLAPNGSNQLFSWVDKSAPQNQVLYYRIQSLSANGEQYYSNIATASLTGNGLSWLSIYPNPANVGTSIFVDSYLEQETDWKLSLFDAIGRQVYATTGHLNAGLHRQTIALDALAKGTYFLKVQHNGGLEVRKVVVQ